MRLCSILLLGLSVLLVTGHAKDADPTPDEQVLKENKIASDGPALLEFIRARTVNGNDAAQIKMLIKQLGDDDFETREKASAQLVNLGARARAELEKAAMDSDAEVVRRAQDCLKQIQQGMSTVVLSTAVRVLAHKKPAGTIETLLNYLPSADDESVAEEVRLALAALVVKEGKADPVLIAGLTDKSPAKRAGAGAALARANLADQREAVRKLLTDPEPTVRYRVALALTAGKERVGMPALIDLLADAPLSTKEVGTIEFLLYRLAEDKGPAPATGDDAAARRKYRAAWQTWWKEHGKDIDLAKVAEATRTLGCTLVVLLDQGIAIDLDNQNKPRFQIKGLEFPLDVQYLPGDHVLVAEHNGSLVTERDKDNKIVWKKEVDQPLVAQRLPNGNTFIATRNLLLELDKAGKQVFTYTRPGGETIMRAQKLSNGDIAMVTQMGVAATRYIRMDKDQKEIASFAVDVHTSGGRINVLPNGHVLVPVNTNNRVVEHDTQGKIVWDVTVDSPIAATRLPNGHTLVTSMKPELGAMELDRNGKKIWQYTADTRVTRAYRR